MAGESRISGLISGANQRLRAGKVGMVLELRLERIVLRGTFPPRPGSIQTRPYQQRLTTGIHANPAGVKQAEALAKEIGALLDQNRFRWEDYLRQDPKPEELLIKDWVEKFRIHYQATYEGDHLTTTWAKEYERVFRELPGDRPLNQEVIVQALNPTKPGTRTRLRFVNALGALAKFAGIPFERETYRGSYRGRNIQPRQLPTDTMIAEWFGRFRDTDPAWAWVYALMACYGLRPGEVWHIDLDSLRSEPGILSITGGKTGSRQGILPLYPEWWHGWNLPAVELPRNGAKDQGGVVSKHFKRVGVPFIPYDLRHAWAGRAALFGVDIGSAAYQMGHSVPVHQRHYGHWYTHQHQRRVFQQLISRTDRPHPPDQPKS